MHQLSQIQIAALDNDLGVPLHLGPSIDRSHLLEPRPPQLGDRGRRSGRIAAGILHGNAAEGLAILIAGAGAEEFGAPTNAGSIGRKVAFQQAGNGLGIGVPKVAGIHLTRQQQQTHLLRFLLNQQVNEGQHLRARQIRAQVFVNPLGNLGQLGQHTGAEGPIAQGP